MTFDEYQELAMQTANWKTGTLSVQPDIYCALKLNGESGEVAEKIGKIYRDQGGEYSDASIKNITLELGDVLWYIAGLCEVLGLTIDQVATENIKKLRSRRERGVIHGDGDDR